MSFASIKSMRLQILADKPANDDYCKMGLMFTTSAMPNVSTFIFLLLWTGTAAAASFDIQPLGPGRPDLIVMVGEIFSNDDESFRAVAERTSNAVVALAGPGGHVVAGLAIGETIRLKNFATIVLDGDACASACALAWLGDTQRYMGEGSKIGFHAARDVQSGDVSGMGNALVGAYLNRIGLPMQAVVYITMANPDTIVWLNQPDAKVFGIEVEVLASRPAANSASGENPPSSVLTPMETEAVNFVRNHFAAETTALSYQVVQWHYADTVFYYGKNQSRKAVLDEFQAFIQRWPERQYDIRAGSMPVQCFSGSQVCNFAALIDWATVSRQRGKRSQGRSTWSLSLIRQNAQDDAEAARQQCRRPFPPLQRASRTFAPATNVSASQAWRSRG
jgi:hypothetical protein